jgi:hypothetical protein
MPDKIGRKLYLIFNFIQTLISNYIWLSRKTVQQWNPEVFEPVVMVFEWRNSQWNFLEPLSGSQFLHRLLMVPYTL